MASVAFGYLPILLFLIIALGLSAGFVVLPMIVARFTGAHKPDAAKLSEYECGFPAFEDARADCPAHPSAENGRQCPKVGCRLLARELRNALPLCRRANPFPQTLGRQVRGAMGSTRFRIGVRDDGCGEGIRSNAVGICEGVDRQHLPVALQNRVATHGVVLELLADSPSVSEPERPGVIEPFDGAIDVPTLVDGVTALQPRRVEDPHAMTQQFQHLGNSFRAPSGCRWEGRLHDVPAHRAPERSNSTSTGNLPS